MLKSASLTDSDLIKSLKYLIVPSEERCQMETKSFDELKRQWWAPDTKELFTLVTIQEDSEENDKTITVLKHTTKENITLRRTDLLPANPIASHKCDDIASMPHINDATILHNLCERYLSNLIYTHSGLFCIVINPYRFLPIYTLKVTSLYRGRNRSEVPPHLYSIADTAYTCMLRDRENQSMIITGESGAGKTENAKKAIQYFARIATRLVNFPVNLEDQISSAQPLLEAFGNAKTSRNNNSSRFGKFIRIHFTSNGSIAGADIESYLLEKSRVTFQQPNERNFHIFYQLLASSSPYLRLTANPKDYLYTSQGSVRIEGVDDRLEMIRTDKAFDILGFKISDKEDLLKCICSLLYFGNMKWKERCREEQAEVDEGVEAELVAELLGLNNGDLVKCLMKPKIRVGADFVSKGQNREQVVNAISAICKSVYSRCFNWLVKSINDALDGRKTKRQWFIGVLDIAGFEIFQTNGFEQLCINFTNEKLQQLFNHHMFVVEQDEYAKEEISWEPIELGIDLQTCIDLIEKPMGIFSILEEECIVPKATDTTFREKLYRNHFGKHSCFSKSKHVKGRPESHFDVHHYAATVSYNVNGWLENNRDVKNPNVFALFKESKNQLLATLFQETTEGLDEKAGKIKKKASAQTISFCHRKQLNKLMTNLKSTHPHFIRCLIPNELKSELLFDPHLVLHQLHCNNIPDAVRIARKGFPYHMSFEQFRRRYGFLVDKAQTKKKLAKQRSKDKSGDEDTTSSPGQRLTEAILKSMGVQEIHYRLGLTKIFFRTNTFSAIEEMRLNGLAKFLVLFQSLMRRFLAKKRLINMVEERSAQIVIQRSVKRFLEVHEWSWWKLVNKIENVENVLEIKEIEEVKPIETVKVESVVSKNDEAERDSCGNYNLEGGINLSNNLRLRLLTELNELKQRNLDDSLQVISKNQELKNIRIDLETSRVETEEERVLRIELQNQLFKVNGELGLLKAKFEAEDRLEPDNERRKMVTKLARAEEAVEELTARCESLEAGKQSLQSAVEELNSEVEEARLKVVSMERKQKGWERIVGEWRIRCEDAVTELEKREVARRVGESELAKVKEQGGEVANVVEELRVENERLAKSVLEIMEEREMAEKGKWEAEKKCKKAELEREELEACVVDLRAVMEQDKKLACGFSLEVGVLRGRIEGLLKQKDEEFEALRQSHQQALNAMQTSLETEIKFKQEAIKQKKKLEQDLSSASEQSVSNCKTISDLQQKQKKLLSRIVELEDLLEDEQNKQSQIRETVQAAERRLESLADEVEERNLELTNCEKAKKNVETELDEVSEKLSELVVNNSLLMGQKRKLETENGKIKTELEEALEEVRSSEVKLRKACEDAGRLAEELKTEQEYALDVERRKGLLEVSCKEMQGRLAELEAHEVKGGKRLVAKLEKRISELEMELEVERAKSVEIVRELRKAERTARDLEEVGKDEKKRKEAMQEMLEKLQGKVRTYKAQIEETEELAAFNLSKFRRIQQKLEETHASNESIVVKETRKSSKSEHTRASSLFTYRF